MKIQINDEIDLNKIAYSGQCFRVSALSDGSFRFIYLDKILYIKPISQIEYEISCTQKQWDEVWVPYFDLTRDYSLIRKSIKQDDAFLLKASDFGKGIRILRQDPFEMLITFIISQRKSIPAIKKAVETLSEKFGTQVSTDREKIFLFPSIAQLSAADESSLSTCGLGYRLSYILDAIHMVSTGELDLSALYSLDSEALFNELCRVKGVGTKVSNCICLFAYNRVEMAPIDTWIAQAIDKHYSGVNPFPQYGENAGIMQQYIFYYMQGNRGSKA